MPAPARKTPVTTPALKYGPTSLYDSCEANGCDGTARTSCSVCDGHFCRNHVDHSVHVGAPSAGSAGN